MRWGTLIAVVGIASGLAACGSTGPKQVTKVALVTPGSGNDVDWTRQAKEAFQTIVERRHMVGSLAEEVTPAEVPGVLQQLAARGTQLAFAHDAGYADAAARTADRTKLPVLVWGNRAALKPGLVGDVEVDSAASGYVIGALSANATGKKSVAVLIADEGTSWDATNWNLMAGGFIAGARSVAPRVKIRLQWVDGAGGRPVTPADTKRVAEQMLRRGTQTIFALGGASAIGVLRAIDRTTGEQEYAGVIGDKATVNTESDVVTSIVYRFETLFSRAIADLRAGRFGQRPYTLSFANGGLRLLKTGRTPENSYELGLAVAARIARGNVRVPDTPTRAGVRALFDNASQVPAR